MKKLLLLPTLYFLLNSLLYAQAPTFSGNTVSLTTRQQSDFERYFLQYQLYDVPTPSIDQYVKTSPDGRNFRLKLDRDHDWEIVLYDHDMRSADYSVRFADERGIHTLPKGPNITYKGYVNGDRNQEVRLTIDGDFFYGYIEEDNQTYFIEPAGTFSASASRQHYTVYTPDEVVIDPNVSCAATDIERHAPDVPDHSHDHRSPVRMSCIEVELAIASDYSMYADHGSTVGGVTAQTLGVMNNVAGNYDDEFADDISFLIVEQFVSTCPSCDPWTASNDASTLLSDFRGWGNSGGFNASFDLGQMWTNRNICGSGCGVVGLAYISAVCGGAKYHLLEDYTTNAGSLRVLTSHEIGHNFGCPHNYSFGSSCDPPNRPGNLRLIMDPSVSSAAVEWSDGSGTCEANSVNTVDNFVQTIACLTACTAAPCPPVTGLSITGVSPTGLTASWTGTSAGNYRVRIRAEGDGTNFIYTQTTSNTTLNVNTTLTQCETFEVLVESDCGGGTYSAPMTALFASSTNCADFAADKQAVWAGGATINFTDLSNGGTSWNWNFGDGMTSTAQNPSHTYAASGVYTVTLSINSNESTITKTNFITVMPSLTPPYTSAGGGNFETNPAHFGASAASGSEVLWERGSPSGTLTTGSTVWKTNLDGDISNTDNTYYLYSPNFNFSGAGSYTLNFTLWMDILYCNAPLGLQVQYSTDGGSSWTRLGTYNDPLGTNWYNSGSGNGCPALMSTAVFADQEGWIANWNTPRNVSYDVSALAGNSSLIFRWVFRVAGGFAGGYDQDGVMIDNMDVAFSATLPVELGYFNGQAVPGGVTLSWQTLLEENNDKFILQRARDSLDFHSIAEVPGLGNSTRPQTYQYLDPDAQPGLNYYRLKQVDFDGQSSFSSVVEVNYEVENQPVLIPNPAHDQATLMIYATQEQQAVIQVIDMLGKVHLGGTYTLSSGNTQIPLQLTSLPAGSYWVRITQEGQLSNLKMVKY